MGKKMIKRADGSYSQRGFWDNIRANIGSGKKPTKKMLEQEAEIKAEENKMGGKRSKFGMLSVEAGIDNNPNSTQADRIAGATSKKKMMGGSKAKTKMMKSGGKKMSYMKKGGKKKQSKMMYEKGGFLSEPSVFDLDRD